MAALELFLLAATVATLSVLAFNPIWFLNLLLLVISYFAVFFFIESIVNSGNYAKRRTFKTEFIADVVAYLFNTFKTMRSNLNDNVIEKPNEYCGDNSSVQNELNTFARNITNDFIKIWYTTVSDDTEFVDECENAFKELFQKAFVDHFSRMEVSTVVTTVLDNIRNSLLNDYNSLDLGVERDYGVRFVNELLLEFLQPSSLKPISKRKLHGVNGLEDPVYITIRELLVDGALLPLVCLVTDPLWLNTVIIKLLSVVPMTNPKDKVELNDSIDSLETAPVISVSEETKREESLSMPSTPENEKTKNNLLTRSKSAVFDSNLLMSPSLASSPTSSASEPDISCETTHNVPEGDEICNLQIFTNVKIPKTQEVNVSNEQFIVYCIEYDALFEEIHGNDKSNIEREVISSSLVRKKGTVKRRFREFTTLQSRLENNSQLKCFLKGVKEPSRLKRETQNFLDMAFGKSKLDRKTISYRQHFLEKYLIFLCNQEQIARSVELQQFLGYGSDSRYAYVKTAQSILMPLRLDKVFTKSVKGAMKLIKVAMPEEPQDGVFAPSYNDFTPRKNTSRAVRLTYGESFKLEYSLRNVDKERFFNINRDEFFEPQDYFGGMKNCDISLLGPRLQGDGCEKDGIFENGVTNSILHLYEEAPLGSNVFDILACILWNRTAAHSPVSLVSKVLFGQVFERFAQTLISKYITKDNVIYLTHCLHESIWDPEESSKTPLSENTPELVVQTLYSSISQDLPFKSKLHRIYKSILYKFVDCYQVQQRNKLFVYSLLRQLFLRV